MRDSSEGGKRSLETGLICLMLLFTVDFRDVGILDGTIVIVVRSCACAALACVRVASVTSTPHAAPFCARHIAIILPVLLLLYPTPPGEKVVNVASAARMLRDDRNRLCSDWRESLANVVGGSLEGCVSQAGSSLFLNARSSQLPFMFPLITWEKKLNSQKTFCRQKRD